MPWKEMLHTVAAHEVSPLPLPAEKTKLGKVSLMTNSIEILISSTNEETGEEEEVGKGYSVGKYHANNTMYPLSVALCSLGCQLLGSCARLVWLIMA